MKKEKRKLNKSSKLQASKPKCKEKLSIDVLLESGTLESIQIAKNTTEENLKFQFAYYAELAQQRSANSEAINSAIIKKSKQYSITNWQRAVKYKYGLHPFSTVGSLSYIGGRFNTGKAVNSEVPSFSALYLAFDKDTALQEHLGQQKNLNQSALTPREVALSNPSSETIVSVSGKFDKIFDLTVESNLKAFIKIVKNFRLSPELIKWGKSLNLPPLLIVESTKILLKTLMDPDWRAIPSRCDVPSNAQIFGHLINSAGIDGILYKSKFTNKLCLALYPKNFANSDSYVELVDETPHPKVPTRIDGSNWRICDLSTDEILKQS